MRKWGIDMQGEVWKAIPGAPAYEASNMGRVRSIDRVVTQRHEYGMMILRKLRGRVMRSVKVGAGYRGVSMRIDGKARRELIHRIVLMAFVGPEPANMQGCHNDGNPANNALSNLRWDTIPSNMADKKSHGTWNGGMKNPAVKFPDDLVDAIRSGRMTYAEAADRGVSCTHFNNILAGRRRAPMDAVKAPARVTTKEQAVALLATGDYTALQLSKATGKSRRAACQALADIRRQELIHVCGWHRLIGGCSSGDMAAIYRIGQGDDAPKPYSDPLEKARRSNEKRRLIRIAADPGLEELAA